MKWTKFAYHLAITSTAVAVALACRGLILMAAASWPGPGRHRSRRRLMLLLDACGHRRRRRACAFYGSETANYRQLISFLGWRQTIHSRNKCTAKLDWVQHKGYRKYSNIKHLSLFVCQSLIFYIVKLMVLQMQPHFLRFGTALVRLRLEFRQTNTLTAPYDKTILF